MTSPDRADRITGCLLGLALGDAFGAPCEGGLLERLVWRLIGRTAGRRRFTDDTQMSLDLGEALLEAAPHDPDLDALAARFAASWRWSRGYGPGAARTLRAIRRGRPWPEAARLAHPDGSLGNGAAMRAPLLGALFAADRARLDRLCAATSAITHAHPEGIAGARLVARWTADITDGATPAAALRARLADAEAPFTDLLRAAADRLADAVPDPRRIAATLGNGITARASCVTAMYAAAAFAAGPFDDLLRFARQLGGDVDTIGAMAGAGWGAHRGAAALPARRLAGLEAHEAIEALARRLAALDRRPG